MIPEKGELSCFFSLPSGLHSLTVSANFPGTVLLNLNRRERKKIQRMLNASVLVLTKFIENSEMMMMLINIERKIEKSKRYKIESE